MNDKLSFVSYTLAAMAGIFFISGLAILTDKGATTHEQIGNISDHARQFTKH